VVNFLEIDTTPGRAQADDRTIGERVDDEALRVEGPRLQAR
jgi:hypothetical protein